MFRALCASIALVLGSGFAADLSAQGTSPRKVALLVGVSKYLKPGFKDLTFCEADVEAVGKELEKLGFTVTILLGSNAGERQATRANIEAAATTMVAPLGKTDVALIMLSGHGQQLDPNPAATAAATVDPNALLIDRTTSYFCPVDAVADDPSTQVSISRLTDVILAPNVGTKLLLVDACRDIPPSQLKSARKSLGIQGRTISLPEDTGVYFSCRAGQFSYEGHDLGHGLFTYCLLDGLRGGAARDGELAWADLVAHVNRRMVQPDMIKFMSEQRQVPIPAGAVPHTVLGRLDPSRSPPGSPGVPGPSDASGRLDRQRTNSIGMKFTLIPAGSFQMGSRDTRASLERHGFVLYDGFDPSNEYPAHQVQFTKPFYLGTYEVTKGQFAEFVRDTGYQTDAETDGNGGWGYDAATASVGAAPQYTWQSWGTNQSDSSPVVNVTWHDASAYCEWLSRKERLAYRLPTEAEWEYACRAGTATHFFTGDAPNGLKGYGNLQDASFEKKFPQLYDFTRFPSFPFDDGWPLTAPVGRFRPNGFGLHDMYGNAWEWCADWYGSYSDSPSVDPQGPSSGEHRIVRGGGWLDTAWRCRSASRSAMTPSYRDYNIGFRVALSPAAE